MFRLSLNLLSQQVTRRCYSAEPSILDGTLHRRFFEHLKQNKQITDQKLSMTIQMFREVSMDTRTEKYRERLKETDKLCVRKIRSVQPAQIYGLLDALIYSLPGAVLNLRSYPEAVKILISDFERIPTKDGFLKLCFYVGLFKTKSPGPTLLTGLVQGYLDEMIDELSSIDFAIVCTATFKASVRIDSKKFKDRLVNEIVDMTTIDDYIFIAFIKSLRLNKINSSLVIDKLKKLKASDELQEENLLFMAHVLPVLADNCIKDDELTDSIVERCIAAFDENVRIKDIGMLLYACALLNHPIKLDHLKMIESLALEMTEQKEFLQRFDDFVDVGLSMWMLNFRCRPFIDRLISDRRLFSFGDRNRIKLDSRKKLLSTCIEIEEPSWIENVSISSPSFDEQRPAPSYHIRPTLEAALKELQGKNTIFVQQIRNLNVAGILVSHNGDKEHVEVLDNSNSLSDGISPNGIFALKLRLLKHLGCKVKLVG